MGNECTTLFKIYLTSTLLLSCTEYKGDNRDLVDKQLTFQDDISEQFIDDEIYAPVVGYSLAPKEGESKQKYIVALKENSGLFLTKSSYAMDHAQLNLSAINVKLSKVLEGDQAGYVITANQKQLDTLSLIQL